MKNIKVKKDFMFANKYYNVGDEIRNIKDINIINKLNEKGLIEPLTRKDLEEIKNGFNKPNKKEEEINE